MSTYSPRHYRFQCLRPLKWDLRTEWSSGLTWCCRWRRSRCKSSRSVTGAWGSAHSAGLPPSSLLLDSDRLLLTDTPVKTKPKCLPQRAVSGRVHTASAFTIKTFLNVDNWETFWNVQVELFGVKRSALFIQLFLRWFKPFSSFKEYGDSRSLKKCFYLGAQPHIQQLLIVASPRAPSWVLCDSLFIIFIT